MADHNPAFLKPSFELHVKEEAAPSNVLVRLPYFCIIVERQEQTRETSCFAPVFAGIKGDSIFLARNLCVVTLFLQGLQTHSF